MTGTGIESDPYVVDNLADFRKACNTTKAYVELSGDIDCNDDSSAAQGWETLYIYAKQIDGKGHSIRNLYTSPSNTSDAFISLSSYPSYIKNLNFSNIFFNNAHVSTTFLYNQYFSLYNCNFSGIINSASCYIFNDSNIDATNCTFNFKVNSTSSDSSTHFSLMVLESCELRLDMRANYGCTNINHGCLAQSAYNSYILGNIEYIKSQGNKRLFKTLNFSYLSLKIKRTPNETMYICGNCDITSFYNKDLVDCDNVVSVTNLYALSEAQCKDKNYLNSIGFVVV